MASRRTASQAADLAREAAWSFKRYGFHKPSGAWWGADGEMFHRFMVGPNSQATFGALLAVAVAGVAAVAISQHKAGSQRKSGGQRKARKRA